MMMNFRESLLTTVPAGYHITLSLTLTHNDKGTSDQHSVKEGPYTSRQLVSVSLFSLHVLCVETNGDPYPYRWHL